MKSPWSLHVSESFGSEMNPSCASGDTMEQYAIQPLIPLGASAGALLPMFSWEIWKLGIFGLSLWRNFGNSSSLFRMAFLPRGCFPLPSWGKVQTETLPCCDDFHMFRIFTFPFWRSILIVCQNCFRSETIYSHLLTYIYIYRLINIYRCFQSLEIRFLFLSQQFLLFRSVRSRRDLATKLSHFERRLFMRRISVRMSTKVQYRSQQVHNGHSVSHNLAVSNVTTLWTFHVVWQQTCLHGRFAEHLNRFQTYIWICVFMFRMNRDRQLHVM